MRVYSHESKKRDCKASLFVFVSSVGCVSIIKPTKLILSAVTDQRNLFCVKHFNFMDTPFAISISNISPFRISCQNLPGKTPLPGICRGCIQEMHQENPIRSVYPVFPILDGLIRDFLPKRPQLLSKPRKR